MSRRNQFGSYIEPTFLCVIIGGVVMDSESVGSFAEPTFFGVVMVGRIERFIVSASRLEFNKRSLK